MIEPWHKRHALQIVMQLPETTEDAFLVLDAARELLRVFLCDEKPAHAVLALVRPPTASDANQA
jgi:hypothetical protein